MFSSDGEVKACRRYEARLEEYVEGTSAGSARLEAHLAKCARCRTALETARSVQGLFANVREPETEPRLGFAQRVMAAINAEEARRSGTLWRPLEAAASRLALSAMTLAAVLLFYFVGVQSKQTVQPAGQQVEVQDIFPESAPHPANQDDVLLTLAAANSGNHYGK
jgi:predicted anti-sigma-YlaC factor YlaD